MVISVKQLILLTKPLELKLI